MQNKTRLVVVGYLCNIILYYIAIVSTYELQPSTYRLNYLDIR